MPSDVSLSDEVVSRIDAACDSFEMAWRVGQPRLEDTLDQAPEAERSLWLRALLEIELEVLRTRGATPDLDAYLSRFPNHEDVIRATFDPTSRLFAVVIPENEAELAVPFEKADRHRLTPLRYAARFNCPHCQNPIEIVADSVDEEVICPSCGSSLNLDTGRSLTWNKQRLPKIAQFELLEAVGRGAFGTVYKARDEQLQRLVAIKIPRSGVLETDEDEDRFVREARNAAQLRHPGIVAIHSVGRSDTFPYLVSEFAEGVTLAEYLTAKRFSMQDGARLIRDVALALQHAHEQGVVHRDLKPSNIMLAPDGSPRLMDFGCAKRDAGEITMTLDGQILGTPAYMSPEQARGHGHQADARSDIYSVGVILFQLLTGELPFRGDVRMLLYQVLHDEPPNPRRLNHSVPRDLETICLKCLAKEPKRRYASAGDLADDLQRYLGGHPILARPVGQLERASRWCRRNPTIAGLSGLAVLLLLLTAVVSSVAYVRESRLANRNAVLAEDKSRLAEEKSLLAEDKSKLANEKSQLADLEKSARETADTNARKAADEATRANREADSALQQTKLAKRHLYAAHMNLAQSAWEDARVAETIRLLELYRPIAGQEGGPDDLRGFEWCYWDRLCHSELLTLNGDTGWVHFMAFSQDGKRLASGAAHEPVKVWDVATGQELLTLKTAPLRVTSVAFSPDGQRLASTGGDTLRPNQPGEVKIWDATTGQELMTLNGHLGLVNCVAFRPDGKRLASGSHDETVKVWDATTGEELLTLKGHTHHVNSVAFSPDGKRLASAGWEPTIKVWDATTGQQSLTLKGHTLEVNSVVFSPDGMRLASASRDQTVRVWDAVTGQESRILTGHIDRVMSVVFSPNSQRLASASWDRRVKVWDAVTGRESLTLKGHNGVAISPDWQRLASVSFNEIKVWDLETDRESRTLTGHPNMVTSVAFTPDGKRIASASWGREVKVFDTSTGQEFLSLKGHTGQVNSVMFSPDGQWLATASHDKTLKVWDAATGLELRTLKGPTGSVLSVAFSPNGKQLATASLGQAVKVWDATTGLEALSLKGRNTNLVTGVAFSRDGQRLASVSSNETMVWDATTGEQLLTLKRHSNTHTNVVFSPDGQRLATAEGLAIKVWDAATGRESLTLKGHTQWGTCVVFSPDGKRLASANQDGTVKVWDAATGEELLTLKGNLGMVNSVVFSPDGQWLASGNQDGTVKMWDARPWTPEVRADRDALSLIYFLRDQAKPKAEWLDAITADQTISEPVRQRALQFARDWK